MFLPLYATRRSSPRRSFTGLGAVKRQGSPDATLASKRTVISRSITVVGAACAARVVRSEEHTSELQSLMRISYAVFCLKKKNLNIMINRSATQAHTDRGIT